MPDLTPTQAQRLTLAFVIAITFVVLAYDILVIRAYGVEASISRVMQRFFAARPTLFVMFVIWLGVLIGHLMPVE